MHSHTSLLELQCRCAGAAAACRDLCASLEVAAVRLSALAEGMAPRLAASVDRSNEAGLKVFVALGRLGASPVAELHRLCHVAAKGLEAQGEAEAVSSRQLVACALMAEVAAASGDLAQLDAALRFLVPLVLLQNAGHDTGAWLEAYAHTRAALGEVDTMSCVADALPGVGCVSGAGAEGYVTTAPNTLSITLVGSTGEPLETVFPCDVGVRLSGGVVTGVAPWPPAPGVVCVDYTVPRGCTAPLTLRFDVMGTPLPLPLHLQEMSLAGSAILCRLPSAGLAALSSLLTHTLRGAAYTLLYSGTRHGMTAAAFHGRCDGAGPTLTLIRSDGGMTFGGFAGASWESRRGDSSSSRAFLLSVWPFLPGCEGPTLHPVVPGREGAALGCDADCGPCFGDDDLRLSNSSRLRSAPFSRASVYGPGRVYEARAWPKAAHFVPAMLEVYAVTALAQLHAS